MRTVAAPLVLGLSLIMLAGCGGGEMQGPTHANDDLKQLHTLVNDLAESSGQDFNRRFTKAALPPRSAQTKFRQLSFLFAGDPSITGNDATGKVKITSSNDPNKALGEKDWKFVKEGTGWKIKEAPLP